MKIKTSELTGATLDWAVAKCEGIDYKLAMQYNRLGGDIYPPYIPSTNWAQGGPILDRERMRLEGFPMDWEALYPQGIMHTQTGPTPLVAIMRCYIASKLGDEIEIPNELT